MNELTFRQRLEKHNNPEEVRQRLAAGKYNQQHARIAQEYLDSLERKDASAVATRSEAREEEKLEISRKALRNSVRATTIAIIALVLSTIMAIQKIIEWYSK